MRIFLLAVFFLAGCTEGVKTKGIQLGVDPNWYPLDFGPQVSYVNGFTEDLLLHIAMRTKIDYVRLLANPDNLFSHLQSGQYDAVLTSLPDHHFNKAKYDFSRNFLELGPVLIVPARSRYTELRQMDGRSVGIIANDPAIFVLQPFSEIITRSYSSIPDLLNAVVVGEIEGALLPRIPASNFIRDLYLGQLKIVGKPLTSEGLHLITLKGRAPKIIHPFNQALESLEKKKMHALLKKWQLD